MIDEKVHNELREKYNPDGSVLRNFQLQLLDNLKYFDAFCKENGIRYCYPREPVLVLSDTVVSSHGMTIST